MAEGFIKLEMVRMASGELGGNSSPLELAAFIECRYGMQIKPVIVTILLGSLQEQEHLARVRQLAREVAEQGQIEAASQGGKKANGGNRTRSKKCQLPGADNQPLPAPDPPPLNEQVSGSFGDGVEGKEYELGRGFI